MPYEKREELRGWNLGLNIRAHADVAVTQDLSKATVGLKGFWHEYKHDKYLVQDDPNALSGELFSEDGHLGVEFNDYDQPVYKADAKYINTSENNQELQLILTYKIALRNQSSLITTRINSIVDYFDSRCQFVGASGSFTGNVTTKERAGSGNYKGLEIALGQGVELAPSQTKYIYVELKLGRADAENMLGKTDETIENVVEISSYTSTPQQIKMPA